MMHPTPDLDLMRRFKERAQAALPGRVARVVLFGSRARREAGPTSDWDLAVFLRQGATCADTTKLADAAYDLMLETGQVIHPIALPDNGHDAPRLLLGEIERDGVSV